MQRQVGHAHRERYATTLRTAARISSGEALSPALADMCDQATSPSGPTTSEPPSCAAFPIVRVWILRLRAPARRPFDDAGRAEQLGHARDLRAGGPVADPLLVGEHWQLDPLPPAELGGVARGRLSDQHEIDAGGLEITPGAIQLDRVILTENSPVVAEPDERGRVLAPQVAEADVVASWSGRTISASPSARVGGVGLPAGMRCATLLRDTARVAQSEPKVLWTPSPEWIERTTLTRYQAWLEEKHDLRFEGYHDLWRWSVFDLEGFWKSLVEFSGVRFSEAGDRVLGNDAMPGAKWFPGSRLSYAEHMFAGKDPAALAIQHASESRELASMTWGELRALTASIAAGLRASGVGEGDRVAAYMPNIPETVAALFACASIGAVWSSAAPEFGVRSVVDRFSQIEPKVLLAVDGYRYGGKDFDRRDAVDRIAARDPVAGAGRAARVSGRVGLGGRLPRASESAGVRAAAVRPSAVGPVLVGDDRAAEADRPRPGRDPARAPEEGVVCTSTPRPAIGCSGSRRPAG